MLVGVRTQPSGLTSPSYRRVLAGVRELSVPWREAGVPESDQIGSRMAPRPGKTLAKPENKCGALCPPIANPIEDPVVVPSWAM